MPRLNATCIFIRSGVVFGCLILVAVYHTVTALPILEIFMKARPGEFLSYSYFSEFEIHGDCVAITLIQSGVTSEGEKCNLCGGGATYVFRKEAGDWKGKFFSGWIS